MNQDDLKVGDWAMVVKPNPIDFELWPLWTGYKDSFDGHIGKIAEIVENDDIKVRAMLLEGCAYYFREDWVVRIRHPPYQNNEPLVSCDNLEGSWDLL